MDNNILYIGLNGYPSNKVGYHIDYRKPDRDNIDPRTNETILSAIYEVGDEVKVPRVVE